MDARNSTQSVSRSKDVARVLQFCRGAAPNGVPNDLIYQMATFMPTKIIEVIDSLVREGVLNPLRVREIATYREENDHGDALRMLCLQKIDNSKAISFDQIKIDLPGINKAPGFEVPKFEEFLATEINAPIETDQMLRTAQFLVDNGVDVNCRDIANPEHRNYAKKTLLENAYGSDERGGINFLWTKFLITNGAVAEDIVFTRRSDEDIIRNFNEVRDSMQNPLTVASSASAAGLTATADRQQGGGSRS